MRSARGRIPKMERRQKVPFKVAKPATPAWAGPKGPSGAQGPDALPGGPLTVGTMLSTKTLESLISNLGGTVVLESNITGHRILETPIGNFTEMAPDRWELTQ